MGPVVYFGLCLLGCLAFSPSVDGVRDLSLPRPRPRSPCNPGAHYYKRMCYQYVADNVNWDEAENNCLEFALGHLASIQTTTEGKIVSNYIKKANGTSMVWIGFRAKCVNQKLKWGWSDGHAYLAGTALWDGRRPSTTCPSGKCVETPAPSPPDQCIALSNVQTPSAPDRWAQFSCTDKYPYICKYPENWL